MAYNTGKQFRSMDMSGNQECVLEDSDNHNVMSITDDGNVELSVFGIQNALEQPNVRVYTALDLHSKPRNSVSSLYTLQQIVFLVLIHHGKIDLYPPSYQ